MQVTLNPYIGFKDNARQAMEFYKTVFGGTLEFRTFKEFHASEDQGEDNKIMHSVLQAGNGVMFMAADTPNGMEYKAGTSISMSLTGEDRTELSGYFDKLSAGGRVLMPLEKAEWGDTFGMCVDKFGVQWMVSITAKK